MVKAEIELGSSDSGQVVCDCHWKEPYKRIGLESICTFLLSLQISLRFCTKCNLVLIAATFAMFCFKSPTFDLWESQNKTQVSINMLTNASLNPSL